MASYNIDNVFSNNCSNEYFLGATDFKKFRKSLTNSSSSELLIIQFNARGMSDITKFHSILEFIATLELDFHLLVIGEIWIKSQDVNYYKIDGFNSVFACRDDRPGGGVAMFIRVGLNYEIIKTDESDHDFNYIQVKLNDFSQNYITAIYRPPDSNIYSFFDELEIIIHKKHNNVIIGDINIPINKSSSVVSDYNNLLLGYGMVSTNTFETRSISKNILDHVLCGFNGVDKVSNATIFSDISDHNFIISSIIFNRRRIHKLLKETKVNFSRVDFEFREYLTSLTNSSLDPNLTLTHITEKYDQLVTKYTCVYYKFVKVKNTYCPWLTYEIWQLIKKKEKILKKRKQHLANLNNSHNVNHHMIDFNQMLRNIDKTIKREKYFSKKKYFEKLFGDAPNQRDLWNNINALLGRTNKCNSNYCVNINGVLTTESKQIATAFNNYFTNVGVDLADNIVSDRNIYKFGTCENVSSTFFIKPTSPNEIMNMINDLDISKSGGPYYLSSRALKLNADVFSKLLSRVFNDIFQTGIYPDVLKLTKVIPIFKSGDKSQLSNYRPISTLPVLDKLLEKLLAIRINSFLDNNDLLYKFQYGFRKGNGTDVALVETFDMISSHIDKQSYVFALFLDLKKAFDTVDHGLLLDKLYCYGFRGKSYNLIKSYLSDRKQYVFIDNNVSDCLTVKCGVPQGSVLGPLLFLLFINDIGKLPLKGKLRLFADDAALFFDVKDPLDGLHLMQHDLNKLHQFFNANLLSLNLTKTKYMVFRSLCKSLPSLPNLNVSNVNIELVESYRYLGMIFDSHLNWQAHIDMIRAKTSPIIGFIRKASNFIPTKILRSIYYAFIHSRIAYGLIVYGNSSISRLKKIQVAQNRCIKAIYSLPRLYSTSDLYVLKAGDILPIKALHFLQIVKYVHRIKIDTSCLSNLNLYSFNHRYRTRNRNNLKLCSITNEYGRSRISFMGPKLYNELSSEVKLKSLVHFKKKCT